MSFDIAQDQHPLANDLKTLMLYASGQPNCISLQPSPAAAAAHHQDLASPISPPSSYYAKKDESVHMSVSVLFITLIIIAVLIGGGVVAFAISRGQKLPTAALLLARSMPYPRTRDDWYSEPDHPASNFTQPRHINAELDMSVHPARTPRRWLAAFAQGYWSANYTEYVPRPHPFVAGCPDDDDISNTDVVKMNWYNADQACYILSRYTSVRMLGDSFIRHVWTAMLQIATGNLTNGQLSRYSVERGLAQSGLCDKDEAFTERDCRDAIALSVYELPVMPCAQYGGIDADHYKAYRTGGDRPEGFSPLHTPINKTSAGSVVFAGTGLHDFFNIDGGNNFPEGTAAWYARLHEVLVNEANRTQQTVYPMFVGFHNSLNSQYSTMIWSSHMMMRYQYHPANSLIQRRVQHLTYDDTCEAYTELTNNADVHLKQKVMSEDWYANYSSTLVRSWSVIDNVHVFYCITI